MIRTLLALAALALTAPVSAKTDPSLFSELNGKAIIDDAQIIEDSTEAELNQKLVDFSNEFGRQMVIITVPSLHGNDLATFTLDYARHLGIGSKELNDGLVLLIAPNERGIRIEVGYGLEWVMTDLQSGDTLGIVKPYFRAGDYTGGVVAITNSILKQITPDAEQRAADEAARQAARNQAAFNTMMKVVEAILILLTCFVIIKTLLWIRKIPERRALRLANEWKNFLIDVSLDPASYINDLKDPKTLLKRFKQMYDEESLRKQILRSKPTLILKLDNQRPQERMNAILYAPMTIMNLQDPTDEEVYAAVSQEPGLMTTMDLPEAIINKVLWNNGMAIEHLSDPTEEQKNIAIQQNPNAILNFDNPSPEQRLAAFRSDGNLIGKFDNVTDDECKAAILCNPSAIGYIKSPTNEMVELALKNDPSVLDIVIDFASNEQIERAVYDDPRNIKYVKAPSGKLQNYAISEDPELARVIKNPTPKVAKLVAELDERDRLAAEEEARRREEEERRRQERLKKELKKRKERERRRSSYSSSSYGSSSFGSSSSSSGGFSGGGGGFGGGGGSFGGGGASGSW